MPLEALGLSHFYSRLACPVLLIAGDGDKVASFKHQSARLAGAIDCPLLKVEHAGHMVHHIAAEEVATAMETFLATTEPTAAEAGHLTDRAAPT